MGSIWDLLQGMGAVWVVLNLSSYGHILIHSHLDQLSLVLALM